MLNFRVEKTSLHPPDSDLIYDWNRAGGAVFPKRGLLCCFNQLRIAYQKQQCGHPHRIFQHALVLPCYLTVATVTGIVLS